MSAIRTGGTFRRMPILRQAQDDTSTCPDVGGHPDLRAWPDFRVGPDLRACYEFDAGPNVILSLSKDGRAEQVHA